MEFFGLRNLDELLVLSVVLVDVRGREWVGSSTELLLSSMFTGEDSYEFLNGGRTVVLKQGSRFLDRVSTKDIEATYR